MEKIKPEEGRGLDGGEMGERHRETSLGEETSFGISWDMSPLPAQRAVTFEKERTAGQGTEETRKKKREAPCLRLDAYPRMPLDRPSIPEKIRRPGPEGRGNQKIWRSAAPDRPSKKGP